MFVAFLYSLKLKFTSCKIFFLDFLYLFNLCFAIISENLNTEDFFMSEHLFHFFTGSLISFVTLLLMMLTLFYKGRMVAFAFPLFLLVSSIAVVYNYREGLFYLLGHNLFGSFVISTLILSFMCIVGVKKIEKNQSFNQWIDATFDLLTSAALVITLYSIYSFNSNNLIYHPFIGFILFYCALLFVKTISENKIEKIEV